MLPASIPPVSRAGVAIWEDGETGYRGTPDTELDNTSRETLHQLLLLKRHGFVKAETPLMLTASQLIQNRLLGRSSECRS